MIDMLDDHLGEPWESAFRDHVRRLAASAEIGDQVMAVGPFWGDRGEHETCWRNWIVDW